MLFCKATDLRKETDTHMQIQAEHGFRQLLYQGVGHCIQRLDFTQVTCCGAILGDLMWMASPKRRKIATQALIHHLGENKASAVRIARKSFQHTGTAFLEMFLTRKVDHRFTAINISFTNSALYRRMMDTKRPIVATSGHFGAWELMAPLLALHFRDRARQIIVKHPQDRAFARLMDHYRGLGGNIIIGQDQAASQVLRCLYRGGVSGFLVDHNTKRSKGTFLPFLRDTASVNIGPAVLALRTKALVLPIFLQRVGAGRYTVHVEEPLDPTQLQGPMQDKVKTMASFYTHAVEKMILRFPEQWFWMHKRWRTRSLEEKEKALKRSP